MFLDVQLPLRAERGSVTTLGWSSLFEGRDEVFHGLINLLVFGRIQALGKIVEGQLSAHLVANVLHHDVVLVVSLDLLEVTQKLLFGIVDRPGRIKVDSRGVYATRLNSMREVTIVLLLLP